MKPAHRILTLFVLSAVLLAACTSAAPKDLLTQITQRGTIVVSTDPNYAPQSVLKQDGKRTEGTKCASDQMTAGELEGFDIDVAVELGKRLGVETCFATPEWDAITAGNWGDRWDISVGSMTIKPAREKVLYFTTPYYYATADVAVAKNSGISKVEDLAGKPVCVGTATTYEDWLNGVLDIRPDDIYFPPPAGVTVVPLSTDQECAQSIQAGRTDFSAYVTSQTVIKQNIAQGVAVVDLGAVFAENLAVAVDKAHTLDAAPLAAKLDELVKAMHADGTLARFSTQWFGEDLTQAPK